MPLQKTEAIVIKSINYGETSKILTLYAREFGKISVMAKGARNLKSRFGGTLELLNYIAIVFYEKKTRDIQILSQVDVLDTFDKIKQDLKKTALAMAVCELINQLEAGQEANPLLFRLLLSTFRGINDASATPMDVFQAFQIHIFDIMGFRPNFYDCIGCKKSIETTSAFDLQAGGLLCQDCQKTGNPTFTLHYETILRLRVLQKTHITKLHGLDQSETSQRQIDEFLHLYLKYHVEGIRDLKALKFFNQV